MTRKNYGSTRKPKRDGNTDHKKERFYPCKPVKLIFFCFMHPSFTCRLAFVTCASLTCTNLNCPGKFLTYLRQNNNPLTGSFCKLSLKQ